MYYQDEFFKLTVETSGAYPTAHLDVFASKVTPSLMRHIRDKVSQIKAALKCLGYEFVYTGSPNPHFAESVTGECEVIGFIETALDRFTILRWRL